MFVQCILWGYVYDVQINTCLDSVQEKLLTSNFSQWFNNNCYPFPFTILVAKVASSRYHHSREKESGELRLNPCTRHGGGTLIYVSHCFSHTILFKGSPEFEFIVISIFSCNFSPQTSNFYIALFYRPPNTNVSLLDTLFSTLCNLNPTIFVNFCIIGDFNINFLSPPTYLYQKLLSVMSSFS